MNKRTRANVADAVPAPRPVTARAAACAALLLVLLVLPPSETRAQPPAPEAPSPTRGTVVFVHFEQVFTNYYKTRLANDQLLELSDSINRERAVMVAEYDQMQKDYTALRERLLASDLPGEEADTLRTELDEKLLALKRQEERIETFNQAQETRWIEQNRRIRNNLVEDIQKRMSRFMKARGYLAVVDRSQVNDKNVPAVLYVDETADITQTLIQELNK